MDAGAEVLTQRNEHGTLIRVYKGRWGDPSMMYAIVKLSDGGLLDTPVASLRPAKPTWRDQVRWWLRWAWFAGWWRYE